MAFPPVMVAFTRSGRFVGDDAKYQIANNPHNTVFDAKRLIGRRFTDSSMQSDIKLWPFTVIAGDNENPIIQVDYNGERKEFAVVEISSMVLTKMKTTAEAYLNSEVENVVNAMKIINEPTVAAIDYGFGAEVYSSDGKKIVLIFDLGGGTFDVSTVNIERGKFEVKVVGGDTHLGGEDFDNRMLDYCVIHFNRKNKMEMNTSAKALWRLRSECEREKRNLSSVSSMVETVIDIDCLYEGLGFHLKFTGAKLRVQCS